MVQRNIKKLRKTLIPLRKRKAPKKRKKLSPGLSRIGALALKSSKKNHRSWKTSRNLQTWYAYPSL